VPCCRRDQRAERLRAAYSARSRSSTHPTSGNGVFRAALHQLSVTLTGRSLPPSHQALDRFSDRTTTNQLFDRPSGALDTDIDLSVFPPRDTATDLHSPASPSSPSSPLPTSAQRLIRFDSRQNRLANFHNPLADTAEPLVNLDSPPPSPAQSPPAAPSSGHARHPW
jgi:hypothetical protein